MNRIKCTIIKASVQPQGFLLEILGLPFGGPTFGRDAQREFLTPRTETRKAVGDQIPAVYIHGMREFARGLEPIPEFYGNATLTKIDNQGSWFEVLIEESKKHALKIFKAAKLKTLRASAGVAGILTRKLPSGELTLFVPGELSLIPQDLFGRKASNQFAIARLKSIYDEAGLDWPEEYQEDTGPKQTRILLSKELKK